LGGGMRQSGILAAAGIVALNNFEKGILEKDHEKAMLLAIFLQEFSCFKVKIPQTNIIFLEIVNKNDETYTSSKIRDLLASKGVLVSAWSEFTIRLVIHRDISEKDIQDTMKAFQEIFEN
jgi:threonine aldolase